VRQRDGSRNPEIDVILDTGTEMRGEIVNVSQIGINIRLPVRFADGAVLNLRVQGCSSKGQVLYSRPDGERFFIAVWARESVLP
jgi:hypothetical protein